MITLEDIKTKLKGIDTAEIFFTDLNGRLKSMLVNPEIIESVVENGVGFDGSSIDGMAAVGESDRLIFPALESFNILEFKDEKMGFFIGNIYDERGIRSKCDPRAVLESVLCKAESEYGCKFLTGIEYEFFLLNENVLGKDIHTDSAGYLGVVPHDRGRFIRKEIVGALNRCGIKYEKSHHEVAPSQHEITLGPLDPLGTADRTVLFVALAKRIAREHGYCISFMPKPFDGCNRNALHIHLSMQDQEGKNLFYQSGTEYNLSKVARNFIGGILKYSRETSIIMASTFNSYKAYVIEREAPIVKGWGIKNRSSMLRLPYVNSPENIRIELRNPDPSGNVYLQVAALITMGIQGINEGLDCGKPDKGSAYVKSRKSRVWDNRFIPKGMFEALVEAERSNFLRNLLGERIFNNYMALKIKEWEEHRTHVTQMEHEKYLCI